MSFKQGLAIGVCKLAYAGMRLLGRNGRSLPGMIALKIDRNLIHELCAGHKSIVITGTNGKTTTTHMIQQAIINTYGGAAYDPSSTNLSQGIATTLCLDSTLSGKRTNEWAVIESDEGNSKYILPDILPQVMVVTNLYRDQIDRYPTWTTARDYIIQAIKTSPETILVLNADCQVVASIADAVPNKVIWFGMECDAYDEGIADYDEQVECVECGALLTFSQRSFAHLGDYACPACGRTHHRADVAVTAVSNKQETSCELTLRVYEKEVHVPVNMRAGYDIYNAAAAYAALTALGMPQENIGVALGNFTHAAHRFEIFDINGAQLRLLLMKNTAGCNQLLNMIASEDNPPKRLVCLLGNEVMDGLSTDWIQGVHWEKIITPETEVTVGGPCWEAMRTRLIAAGADKQRMRVCTSYAKLVAQFEAECEDCTVIANCSTIEALRVELTKRYQPLDYWAH